MPRSIFPVDANTNGVISIAAAANRTETSFITQKHFDVYCSSYVVNNETLLPVTFNKPTLFFCLGEAVLINAGTYGNVNLQKGCFSMLYLRDGLVQIQLLKGKQYRFFALHLSAKYLARADRNRVATAYTNTIDQTNSVFLKNLNLTVTSDMEELTNKLSQIPAGQEKSGAVHFGVLQLVKLALKEMGRQNSKRSSPDYPAIERARDYALQNFTICCTITELARKAGLTNNGLFKKQTGSTWPDFVKSLRLERVKLFLINTDKPIELISREAGFVRYRDMHKAFTNIVGKSPREYRMQCKAPFI